MQKKNFKHASMKRAHYQQLNCLSILIPMGVQRDLAENHGRPVAVSFVKKVTDMVGTIALAKEQSWNYQLPDFPKPIE